jgi:hypothetical protein
MPLRRIVEEKLARIEKAVGSSPDAWYSPKVQNAIDQAKLELEKDIKILYGEIEDDFKGGGWALWVTGFACLAIGFGLGLLIG